MLIDLGCQATLKTRILSLLLITLMVLMLVIGSYVQAEALVPLLAAIGAFFTTEVGAAVGGCLVGAAITTLMALGIDYYSGGAVTYHAQKMIDDVKNGNPTPEAEFIDLMQNSSSFVGKTDAEIGRMSSWNFTVHELAGLDSFMNRNALKMVSDVNSHSFYTPMLDGVVSADIPYSSDSYVKLGRFVFTYIRPDSSVKMYSLNIDGTKGEFLGSFPFINHTCRIRTIHFSIWEDGLQKNGKVQFSYIAYPTCGDLHADKGGKFYTESSFQVGQFWNASSVTFTPVSLSNSSSVNVPKSTTVDDFATTTSSDVVSDSSNPPIIPPIDPPITDTGSITQTWLGGILSTLSTTFTGGLEAVKTAVNSVSTSVSAVSTAVLEGVKSIFIPPNFAPSTFLDDIYSKFTGKLPLLKVDLTSFRSVAIPDLKITLQGHEYIVVNNKYLRDNIATFRMWIAGFMALLLMIYNYRQICNAFNGSTGISTGVSSPSSGGAPMFPPLSQGSHDITIR